MSNTTSPTSNSRIFNSGFVFWTLTIFVPLSTLVLVLAGYGTTLAVEQMFGIPANQLATSASDYLQLSTVSAVIFFNKVFEVLLKGELIWQIYQENIFQIICGLVVIAILFTRQKIVKLFQSQPATSTIWTTVKKLRDISKENKILTLSFILISTCPIFLYLIIATMITLIFITYSIVPIIAMGSAKTFIQTNVLSPKLCKPLQRNLITKPNNANKNNSDSKEETFAQCIELRKDGKVVAAGRVIVSTSSRLVLFDPISRKASLHSTEQAVLQSTNEL